MTNGGIFRPEDNDHNQPQSDWNAGAGDSSIDVICANETLNDYGNSRRLITRHGEDLLYVDGIGWAVWDGLRWAVYPGEQMARMLAHKTAVSIYDEVKLQDGRDRKSRHSKHADCSGNSGAITNMLREAQGQLFIKPADLDPPSALNLITCRSGTIELGPTIQLREARRDDRITRCADVEFDPDADCPVFREFLTAVQPDRDMQIFLQTYFGYSITGDTSEQVLVCLQGNGSNGKSTLIRAIVHAIGDYHGNLPVESLLEDKNRSGASASPDIARLPGARFVTASEPERFSALSEGRVKTLTGGDQISARHLHKNLFEYTPQFKITLTYNDPPRIRGTDDGIWRRILVAPFKEKVGPDEVGPLMEALEDEKPGIFMWLLEGARMWFENGLRVPADVRSATRDYKSMSDPIGDFIEQCTVKKSEAWVRSGRLFAAYKVWCNTNDIEPVTHAKFGKVLKGKCSHKRSDGVQYGPFILNEEIAAKID